MTIIDTTLKNMQGYGIKNTNGGSLSINSSVFVNNGTPMLENYGDATVGTSEFTGSTINALSPEYCEHGGAIWNAGSMNVSGAYIHDNVARNGGGIWNSGTLSVSQTSIVSNTARTGGHFCDGRGAGIYMSQGVLNLENSTLAFNAADGSGGGLWFGPNAQGTLLNNTVVSNTNALLSLFGQPVPDAAGIATNANTVTLTNTLVAANSSASAASDCWGPLISGGYNLIYSPTSTCTFSGTIEGNQIGVNPWLGTFGQYGGATPLFPLLTASPAIDAGSPTLCPATDQRGVNRPLDGDQQGSARCDIGSFELE